MKLDEKIVKNVHEILKIDGYSCNESGAQKWLLKRGYTQEQVKKDLYSLYMEVWACVNVPF